LARWIERPAAVEAAGNLPKLIEEFVGRVNSGDAAVSIARMTSPAGWEEPAQTPEFDEYALVLEGVLVVEDDEGTLEVAAGQAAVARAGRRVRYRTPEGASYVSVCIPAFAPEAAHREE